LPGLTSPPVGGMAWRWMASAQIADSSPAAAPIRCPVTALVPLIESLCACDPKTSRMTLDSITSFCSVAEPWALM